MAHEEPVCPNRAAVQEKRQKLLRWCPRSDDFCCRACRTGTRPLRPVGASRGSLGDRLQRRQGQRSSVSRWTSRARTHTRLTAQSWLSVSGNGCSGTPPSAARLDPGNSLAASLRGRLLETLGKLPDGLRMKLRTLARCTLAPHPPRNCHVVLQRAALRGSARLESRDTPEKRPAGTQHVHQTLVVSRSRRSLTSRRMSTGRRQGLTTDAARVDSPPKARSDASALHVADAYFPCNRRSSCPITKRPILVACRAPATQPSRKCSPA